MVALEKDKDTEGEEEMDPRLRRVTRQALYPYGGYYPFLFSTRRRSRLYVHVHTQHANTYISS